MQECQKMLIHATTNEKWQNMSKNLKTCEKLKIVKLKLKKIKHSKIQRIKKCKENSKNGKNANE